MGVAPIRVNGVAGNENQLFRKSRNVRREDGKISGRRARKKFRSRKRGVRKDITRLLEGGVTNISVNGDRTQGVVFWRAEWREKELRGRKKRSIFGVASI